MIENLGISRNLTLKTKITCLVLLLFLCSIWLLTLFITKRLEHEMTAIIKEEQFLMASYIADSIEGQVKLRFNSLRAIADLITPELLANPVKLREFLKINPLLQNLFQTGVVVLSIEGKGIADYPVFPGRTGASFREREYFKDVVATENPAVGKPHIGRFSKKPVIGFAVPVLTSSGKLIAVLAGYTLLSDPALLGAIENFAYKDFPDRLILVFPKYRLIITGSDPTRILAPIPKIGVNPVFDRFMSGFEGSGTTVNSRGIRMLASGRQIMTPGWFVRVGLPIDMAFAPIYSMMNWAYSIALGLSLISSLIAWLIIRQTLRPLSDASSLIKNMTEGKAPFQNITVARHDEVGQLLTNFNEHLACRKQAEEQVARSLKEKEVLLREIHHRVKNNMAVISSLLSLQTMNIQDDNVRGLFEESRQRIKSMALVHEKLYQTKDLAAIDFKGYIESITSQIISLYHINTSLITTDLSIENVELDLGSAVPCGLIINELLTNAFKYAFPDNRSGILSVYFTKADDIYTLTIKDNGVGLPEEFDYKKTSTPGLQLVDALAGQLRGTFRLKSDNGTEAVVTFTKSGCSSQPERK